MRGSKRIQKRKKDQLQERIALSFLPSFLPWLVCCTRVILVVQQHWDFAWNFGMLNLATWTTQKQQQQQLLLQICNYLQHKCRQACKYKIPFLSSSNSFVIPVILPWHFDLIPISNFFGGEGGRGGTLEGRQELLLLLKEEAQRSGVSAVCQWAFKPNDKNIEAWCNKESGLWVQDLGFKPGARYKVYSPCPCTYLLRRLSRTKRILTVFVVKGAFFSPFCFQHKKKLPLLYFILF